MARKYTYSHYAPLRDRQWGFLNEELDQLVGTIGGGGGGLIVTQANTFAVGDLVGLSGGTWVKAQTGVARALGMVTEADAAEFEVGLSGQAVTWAGHGKSVGVQYFLSSTAGAGTSTEPGVDGERQAVFIPLDATTVLLSIGEPTPS